jgi:hypothetical protein
MTMRNTLTVALLSAASLCAFACVTPAAAQTFAPGYGYGYGAGSWPYGPTGTFAGSYPTIPSLTGTGAYSYSSNANAPKPYPNGECQILAGNRVCTGTSAYGYGYGVGGPFGFGAAIAAPVNAAGALAAAPVAAAGALAAAPVAAAGVAFTHTTSNLNLRAGPGTHYPVREVIPAGAEIDVHSCGHTWCYTAWAGHQGYVSHDYLIHHMAVVGVASGYGAGPYPYGPTGNGAWVP